MIGKRVIGVLAAAGAGVFLAQCLRWQKSQPPKGPSSQTVLEPTFDLAKKPEVQFKPTYLASKVLDNSACLDTMVAYNALQENGFNSSVQAEFLLAEVMGEGLFISAASPSALMQLIGEFKRAIAFLERKKELKGGYSKEALLKIFHERKKVMESAVYNNKPILFNCYSLPSNSVVRLQEAGWEEVSRAEVKKVLSQFGLNRQGLQINKYFPAKILAARTPANAKKLSIVFLDIHTCEKTQASVLKILQNTSGDRSPIYFGNEFPPGLAESISKAMKREKSRSWVTRKISNHYKCPGGSLEAVFQAIRQEAEKGEGLLRIIPPLPGEKASVSVFTPLIAHYFLGSKLRISGVDDLGLRKQMYQLFQKYVNLKNQDDHDGCIRMQPKLLLNHKNRGIKMTENFLEQLDNALKKNADSSGKVVGVMQIGSLHVREVKEVLSRKKVQQSTAQLFLYPYDYLSMFIDTL